MSVSSDSDNDAARIIVARPFSPLPLPLPSSPPSSKMVIIVARHLGWKLTEASRSEEEVSPLSVHRNKSLGLILRRNFRVILS